MAPVAVAAGEVWDALLRRGAIAGPYRQVYDDTNPQAARNHPHHPTALRELAAEFRSTSRKNDLVVDGQSTRRTGQQHKAAVWLSTMVRADGPA